MRAIELLGAIDESHRLQADVPENLPAGPVRVILLLPDEATDTWARCVAKDWAADLADDRQDLYTLNDGQPMDR